MRANFDPYVPANIRRPLPIGYYGHLHNIYVQYAAERGIPGLLCVLWFIGLVVWDAVRGNPPATGGARSQELFVLHGTIAVVIGILAGGIFEYNLGDSEVLMMFNCVVGVELCRRQIRYRRDSFEVRRLRLAMNDGRVNVAKAGFLQEALQLIFGEAQPHVGIKLARLLKLMTQ